MEYPEENALYESIHVFSGIVYVIFGGLGSFYALKTLAVLYKSPELWKSQARIWFPILIGTFFFAVGGVSHLAEHFFEDPITDLVYDIATIIGVSFFTIGILRYAQLQRGYYALKNQGLMQIHAEEPLQTETQ